MLTQRERNSSESDPIDHRPDRNWREWDGMGTGKAGGEHSESDSRVGRSRHTNDFKESDRHWIEWATLSEWAA